MKRADGSGATTLRVSAYQRRLKAGFAPLQSAFGTDAQSLEGSSLWAFMKKLNDWRAFFESRGIAPHLVESHLGQIKLLLDNNAPVVLELEHLSLLVGIKYEYLLKMISGSGSFYRTFSIKKRSGGSRTIEAPYPSLLSCQDWIYRNILLAQPVHECAHGYVPERSIFSNAKAHLNTRALLKIDLKDFFPSIGIGWAVNFFSDLGYSKNISYSLAALCCNNGRLVQGAPTSPYLTNILLQGLDERLNQLSLRHRLKYTRYADDLTFSGAYISINFAKVVGAIVSDYGLSVNESKTRLLIDKNKKVVTGLSVSGTNLRITRELRRSIKQDVHYIGRYGLRSHISAMRIKDPFYINSIIGKVDFWLQAEPENKEAQECKNILRSQRE